MKVFFRYPTTNLPLELEEVALGFEAWLAAHWEAQQRQLVVGSLGAGEVFWRAAVFAFTPWSPRAALLLDDRRSPAAFLSWVVGFVGPSLAS